MGWVIGVSAQMIAVISDIHGNLEALEAVLAQIDDADEILCAGDIVGYGPNPNECCELIRERGIKSVQGNHDFVCANLDRLDAPDESFPDEDRELCRRLFTEKNVAAKEASCWTNKVLTEQNKEFLRRLPLQFTCNGITVLHGTPGSKWDLLNEYLLPGQCRPEFVRQVEGDILVVGHSHVPIRTERIVNPGSVGQPRDRNWRASYATFEGAWYRFTYIADGDMSFRVISQLVTIHRVEYDVGKTARKIKAQKGIPDSLGDRLLVGL